MKSETILLVMAFLMAAATLSSADDCLECTTTFTMCFDACQNPTICSQCIDAKDNCQSTYCGKKRSFRPRLRSFNDFMKQKRV